MDFVMEHRLKIEKILQFSISAKIISGTKKRNRVLIPWMDLSSSQDEIPFKITRRQFPVRLDFAMTIHKSQGQTFKHVRVYLSCPIFNRGQLYGQLTNLTNERFSYNDWRE